MTRIINQSDISIKGIQVIKRIYGVFVFLMGTGAIIPVVRENMGVDYANLEVDYAVRQIWLLIYLITVIFIFSNRQRFFKVVFANKLIWIIFGLTLLSVWWSASPAITFRRCVALFFTQVIGIYLYSEFDFEGVIELLALASIISILLSFIFSIFLPSYGIQHDGVYDGVWRGVYINKNSFGQNMVLFIPLWLLLFLKKVKNDRSRGTLPFIFMMLSIILLIKSESKTSLVVCLVILCMIPVCLVIRKNTILSIGLFFSIVTVSVVFIYNDFGIWQAMLESMGKDPTLTGRTKIWSLIIQAIEARPLLGYGYGAFFQGFQGPSAFICNLMEFAIFEAHNGYLGITADLGIAGLLLFTLSLVTVGVRTLWFQARYKSYIIIFPFIFTTYLIIYNTTESIAISQNLVTWIMYSLIATYISYESKNLAVQKQNKIELFTQVKATEVL